LFGVNDGSYYIFRGIVLKVCADLWQSNNISTVLQFKIGHFVKISLKNQYFWLKGSFSSKMKFFGA